MNWSTSYKVWGVWRRWFAWYPVAVRVWDADTRRHTEWAWLEWVEYRTQGGYGGAFTDYRWPEKSHA